MLTYLPLIFYDERARRVLKYIYLMGNTNGDDVSYYPCLQACPVASSICLLRADFRPRGSHLPSLHASNAIFLSPLS